MKRLASLGLVAVALTVLGILTVGSAGATTTEPEESLGRVVVYVVSQGLCYDSFVTAQNLPDHGRFQTLEPDPDKLCGEGSLITEFGPGDRGYVGGRWEMDGGAVRFSCPLIGPGTPPPAP